MTRVVLVTGANRGIGRELARQLTLRGDTVVLTARDLAKAERTAAALPGRERVLARRLDVTNPASIEQVAADLDRRYGRLDVLVNNAAIHYDTWQRASTADLQVVREALEVNLVGAWQTSLTLLPLLRASGHGILLSATSVFAVCEDGLWLDGLLERPGPTVHPMAWVDTRATPKQPAFSGCFGQAVRGRGPSVGHGYKNVNGQGTVTTPRRRPCLTLSGLARSP